MAEDTPAVRAKNGDVEAATPAAASAASKQEATPAAQKTSSSKNNSQDDKQEDGQVKKLPKWVPVVVAVVLVAVTLSAIIPAAVYSAKKEASRDSDTFEARSGELAQAEPLQGAEWLTASFTPAPPEARPAGSIGDDNSRPGLAHGFISDNQKTPSRCATSVVHSRQYGVPVCRSIVGTNDRLCPEGYYKDWNGDCVYSMSFDG